jgi:hypothetical protein
MGVHLAGGTKFTVLGTMFGATVGVAKVRLPQATRSCFGATSTTT